MKKLNLLALLTLITISLFAQEVKYTDLANWNQGSTKGFTSYISKDGSVYKVGDKLTIGVPSSNKTYAFVLISAALGGLGGEQHQLTVSSTGSQTEIKKIQVEGNKRIGYMVFFKTKGNFMAIYNVAIENAIATGEIKSFGMTSDEALNNLKRAKDKLNLGIITQTKYDSIKVELVKFIK